MVKWEYRTLKADARGIAGGKRGFSIVGMLRGIARGQSDRPSFYSMLNEAGDDGWELVSVVNLNEPFGMTRWVLCVFKRQVA